MSTVTGIGGFFFRARDPDALNRWYGEHFGVVMLESRDYGDPGWFQDRGETVFAAFAGESRAFGAPDHHWKINFRVSDLDAMVERLVTAGIEVVPHAEAYPNGRFAELVDPEGNPIQLWEPNAASVARDPAAAAPTAGAPARAPSPTDYARAAQALADVLALAEALPTRHPTELRFPRLTDRSPTTR